MVPPSVQRIDKFDVLRRIGRGGMGSVYLARDPDIDRLVAIKLIHEGFDEEDMRGRFTSEARSASALRHTNIVTIFHTGTFLERPFIVMEYVEGETFADIIASGRPVPLAQKLQLLDQLLAGLQYAHGKGIIHRDIKPSNVMVDAEGVVRILDFGIARLGTGGGLTRSGVVLGTFNYISPEQLAGKPVDPRADIFSAGLVAYELLTSKAAFPQAFPEVVRHIGYEDPPPMQDLCPGIDPALVSIVRRCHAKQADDRYADCGAVRRDLDAVRQSVGKDPAPFAINVSPSTTTAVGAADFGETLRIETRRPATKPAASAEPEAESPRTMVIPGRSATARAVTPAPVTATPPPVSRLRLSPLSVGAAVAIVLVIAIGMWWAPRWSNAPASVSETRTTPEPTPPAAVVPAPEPVKPAPAPAPAEAPRADGDSLRARAADAWKRGDAELALTSIAAAAQLGNDPANDRLLEEFVKVSRERASLARRRAVMVNGRGTQAYAVADVRVGDGERFATRGQLDEAVRAYVEAVRRFGEAVTTAPPPTPVRVGGTVKAPKLLRRVSPEYPVAALTARQQGAVILEATVGTSGKVSDVRVLRSLPALDEAAVGAVRQWEYEPTVIDGVAVPVITSVAVEFKLEAPPPVRVGGTVKPPAQTKRVTPVYPSEAQAAGVQGVVIMEANIGADGKVTDVRVLRSIPLLDKAAMDAVRQFEYAPTLINGIAAPVVMTVTVNFELKPAAPPPAPKPTK